MEELYEKNSLFFFDLKILQSRDMSKKVLLNLIPIYLTSNEKEQNPEKESQGKKSPRQIMTIINGNYRMHEFFFFLLEVSVLFHPNSLYRLYK